MSKVLVAACLTALFALPMNAAAQTEGKRFGLSGELGVGASKAGHGGSFSGKAAVRVRLGSTAWVIGLRAVGADGERRSVPDSFWGSAIETFSETAALLYRTLPLSNGDGAFYLGAGIGRLSGRQFMGTSTSIEYISELGVSMEAAMHVPQAGFRFVLAAHGWVGSSRPLMGVTIGFGLGG